MWNLPGPGDIVSGVFDAGAALGSAVGAAVDVLPNPFELIGEVNSWLGSGLADVLAFAGITAPLVDPEGVREIARRWAALSAAIADATWDSAAALADLHWDGRAAEAFAARGLEIRRRADAVRDSLDAGVAALNRFADEAHDLLAHIGVLAAEIVEFEAAAAGLALLTAGASEAVAGVAAGERATHIAALVVRIEDAGRGMAATLAGLAASISALARAVSTLGPIGRMAVTGAGTTLAWDALFQPERLTDLDTLAADAGAGALLGVAFGASVAAVEALARSGTGVEAAAVGARLGGGEGPGRNGVAYSYRDPWTRHGPRPPRLRVLDVVAEEALGGHTIARHVGKPNAYLRNRLKDSPDLQAASTFRSVTEAQEFVNMVLVQRKPEIEAWLRGSGPSRDFVDAFPGRAIGSVLTRANWRAGLGPESGERVLVTLRRDAAAPEGYRLVRAYPLGGG